MRGKQSPTNKGVCQDTDLPIYQSAAIRSADHEVHHLNTQALSPRVFGLMGTLPKRILWRLFHVYNYILYSLLSYISLCQTRHPNLTN